MQLDAGKTALTPSCDEQLALVVCLPIQSCPGGER
jgi:hypothetical protein